MKKAPKLNVEEMLLHTLTSFEKLGVNGIQIGKSVYRKKGKKVTISKVK